MQVPRIGRFEHLLNVIPRYLSVAVNAVNSGDIPVQLDDAGAAGSLVQTIHILSDQSMHVRRCFQAHQSLMGHVRTGIGNDRPTDHAACPVAPTHSRRAHKILQRHRWLSFPATLVVAIIWNA